MGVAIFGDETHGREVLEPASELSQALFVEVQEFDTDTAAFRRIFGPTKRAPSGEMGKRSLCEGK